MPRVRKGKEVQKNGKWYARVRYTTAEGKRKDLWFAAKNKSDASRVLKEKIRDLEITGEQALTGEKIKFCDLANTYREKKLIPARFVADRKIAGLKSFRPPQIALEALTNHFG